MDPGRAGVPLAGGTSDWLPPGQAEGQVPTAVPGVLVPATQFLIENFFLIAQAKMTSGT